MFSEAQRDALAAKLDGARVKTRSQAGQTLSYIEGWVAISEANRIFGFDGWSRETVETRCVWEGTRTTRQGKELMTASYTARVRVTVRAGGDVIVREGTGAGSGMGTDGGEAHESAIKEAETDAMKRALMTFGNPFGLALYDKTQADVERDPQGGQQRRDPPPSNSFERGKPLASARREMDAGTASSAPQKPPANDPDPKAWASSDDAAEFLRAAKADLSTVDTAAGFARWMQDFRWEHDAIIEYGHAKKNARGLTRTDFLNALIAETQDRCRADLRGAA